ncbi:MAG: hypothetical protein AAGA43_16390 [Bacteroidota bacterium]
MTIRLILFCVFLCALGMISCKEEKDTKKKKLSLDSRYLQIENIHSFANCNGPNGNYTTEVTSEKDGNLTFYQVYEYGDLPFRAELSSYDKGYVLAENGKVSDTLTNISIEMIRSHDFHRLQTNPKSFFKDIEFEKDLENELELYSGIDRLNNPVKLYYDPKMEQIKIIEFPNMMDTTEVIKIEYKKWLESDYGKLAKEIEIIQAEKDTFNFNFKTIEINE